MSGGSSSREDPPTGVRACIWQSPKQNVIFELHNRILVFRRLLENADQLGSLTIQSAQYGGLWGSGCLLQAQEEYENEDYQRNGIDPGVVFPDEN